MKSQFNWQVLFSLFILTSLITGLVVVTGVQANDESPDLDPGAAKPQVRYPVKQDTSQALKVMRFTPII